MAIRVCLAGATGWAGSALARAIAGTDEFELVAAVSRTHAGRTLGEVLVEPRLLSPVYGTAQAALAHPCDVFFDYTHPEVAKENVMAALSQGVQVVIGTSGLSDTDYEDIAREAAARGCGVLAVGNFALTVVLLQKFAEISAQYIPQWEIIEYASDRKIDAPSGTARELAARLGKIRQSELSVPLEETQGILETRGARLNGSQVHSIRLPGYTISVEIIFGLPGQQLTIRHDSGSSAAPYVDGALLAIRKVQALVGLHRGLDSVFDWGEHQGPSSTSASLPLQCHLWHKNDIVVDDLYLQSTFSLVTTFDEESHFIRRLLRCRDCQQLYFYEFIEEIDWAEGNDAQYRTWIPVSSPEAGDQLNRLSREKLKRILPRIESSWPSDEKKPVVRWMRKALE